MDAPPIPKTPDLFSVYYLQTKLLLILKATKNYAMGDTHRPWLIIFEI
jgi:hypothetical protein